LSIPHVGAETARLIAGEFKTLSSVRQASESELAAIDGIGETVAQAVVDWFANDGNSKQVDELKGQVNIKQYEPEGGEGPLTDTTVVFTGSLADFTRQEAQRAARQSGADTARSVSSNTDYLVVGDNPGSKLETAKEGGVDIIDEPTFKQLLNQ